jgi:hypothetical protein
MTPPLTLVLAVLSTWFLASVVCSLVIARAVALRDRAERPVRAVRQRVAVEPSPGPADTRAEVAI